MIEKTLIRAISTIALTFLSIPILNLPANAAECSVTKTYYTGDGTNGTNGVSYIVNKITQTGSCTWTVPTGVTSADVLVVGGGGGAAGAYGVGFDDGGGGGGGGGAFQAPAYPLTPGNSISVTVGAGGGGGSSSTATNRDSTQGTQGSSTIFGLVSGGGGGAGGYVTTNSLANGLAGTAGGGGGGSSYHWNAYNAGSGGTGNSVTISGTTYTGVSGGAGSTYISGAGNAGAGGGRTSATSAANATPGAGIDSYYSGTLTTYGKGGIGYGSTGWSAGLTQTGIGFGGNGGQAATGGSAGANGLIIIRYAGVNTNSFALTANSTSAVYRTASTININVTAPSTVAFYANGKKISSCAKVATSGTSPNIVASCNWKPALHGIVSITAIATPIGGGVTSSSGPISIKISKRPGTR